MAAELASYVETNTNVLSDEHLLTLFRECREEALTPSVTIRLVDSIGGINAVMTTMLQSSTLDLSIEDRKALQQYLSHLSSSQTGSFGIPAESVETKEESLKWILMENDNILYEKSPWIFNHLYSRWIIGLFAVFIVIYMVNFVVTFIDEIFANVVMLIAAWFTLIPWTVAALLSVNKAMIPRIATNVDTWIKAGTGFLMGVWHALCLFNDEESRSGFLNSLQLVFILVSLAVWFFMFFLLVSSIDGLQGWNRYSRIFLVMVAAIGCLVRYIIYEFFTEEYDIDIPWFGSYSIRGAAANASNVLFIFLCKQVIQTWFKGETDRCIAVRYSPFIEWKKAF